MKRDKLNQTIGARPSKSELRKANVLPKQKVSDSLASTAIALEKALKKDKLSNAISSRPSRGTLRSNNVLPPQNVSPVLARNALALETAMKRDAVNHMLRNINGVENTAPLRDAGGDDNAPIPRAPPMDNAKPETSDTEDDQNASPRAGSVLFVFRVSECFILRSPLTVL